MTQHAKHQASYQERFGTPKRQREWECYVLAYGHVLRELDALSGCEEHKQGGS